VFGNRRSTGATAEVREREAVDDARCRVKLAWTLAARRTVAIKWRETDGALERMALVKPEEAFLLVFEPSVVRFEIRPGWPSRTARHRLSLRD
jgi:hypothetical protein